MKRQYLLHIIFMTAVATGQILFFTSCKKEVPVIPTLITTPITDITAESAKSGGTIISDGGSDLLQMGVCWAVTAAPTVNNFTTSDGINSGASGFSSSITGLQPGVTYYVRAYAINSIGTSYGEELSFKTPALTPQVTTSAVTDITLTSAKSGGTVTGDGGAPVTARGVCWVSSGVPSIDGPHTTDGSGTGIFSSNITGLESGTTYNVRAYATNTAGTSYGEVISFTTIAVLRPVVSTASVTSIGLIAAVSGGNVSSDGGGTILTRGICWNTTGDPDIYDSKTTEGGTTGSFTSNMTGLSAGTVYYVRAYATNSSGTAYGSELIFSTSVADINGNIYPTVLIGSQLWMLKDLKTTRFTDNTNIPNVTDNAEWAALTTPAYSWYENNPSYGNTYGIIYNWYAVGTGKLCPGGWHVPTDNDFKILEIYLGMTQAEADATLWRGTDEGTKLKSTTTWELDGPNTNSSGWTALAGGYRYGADGGFVGLGYNTYWWSSTEHWSDTTKGLYRRLRSGYTGVFREGVSKAGGKLVRCLKD